MSLIQLLLKNGADANAKDISGKTPLFNIIFSFSTDLLDLLIKYGADINMRDKYGNSIYTIWGFCKNEIFADLLKKHHGVE